MELTSLFDLGDFCQKFLYPQKNNWSNPSLAINMTITLDLFETLPLFPALENIREELCLYCQTGDYVTAGEDSRGDLQSNMAQPDSRSGATGRLQNTVT